MIINNGGNAVQQQEYTAQVWQMREVRHSREPDQPCCLSIWMP